MFIAEWARGQDTELKAETWVDAIQEALLISAEDPDRDELLKIGWVGR